MPMKFPKEEDAPKGHNFARTLAKKYEVVPYLEDFLSKEIQDFSFTYEPKLKDQGWHPSSHCLMPPSKLLEYAQGGYLEDRKTTNTQQKIFAVGHFWHQLLQHAAVEKGIAQPDAIERRGLRGWGPKPGSDITEWGHVAAMPWCYATGSGDIAPCVTDSWTGVLDFKTMSGAQFRSPTIPAWAAGKYEAQINIYMDFFDCDSGIILSVCKDTPHDMREFKFERNQNLIDAIYEKWRYVSEIYHLGHWIPEESSNIDPAEDEFWDLEEFLTGPIE